MKVCIYGAGAIGGWLGLRLDGTVWPLVNGIWFWSVVLAVVLTAAPVEAEPRPDTAIWLVRWLRTAWAGSTTPAFAGAAETMAPVAWAPLIAPPDVLT